MQYKIRPGLDLVAYIFYNNHAAMQYKIRPGLDLVAYIFYNNH